MSKATTHKKPQPKVTIAFDADLYEAVKRYAEERGMVLRIAAQRLLRSGLDREQG